MHFDLRFAAVACLLAAACSAQEPATLTGRLVERDGRRVLELWGSARQRGHAHGFLLASDIAATFELDLAAALGRDMERYDKVVATAIAPRFDFDEAEEEMLGGMLDGLRAALPPDHQVRALGRRLELVDLKALNAFADWAALGCSTIALWGAHSVDGKPVVARNFDFHAFHSLLERSFVVVNAASEGQLGWVGVSHPGSIGVITGMNEKGVWTSIHDVFVRPTIALAMRANAPRVCALRRLLEELVPGRACADGLELVRGWPTLFGSNFMVVDPAPAAGEPFAAVLEYDNREGIDHGATARLADRDGAPAQEFLACTNHHRARAAGEEEGPPACKRYDALRAAAADGGARALEVADLFALASRAAVPEVGVGVRSRPQRAEETAFGTLHQAVGLSGAGELWVRFCAPGGNIRDAEPERFVVAECLGSLPH